MQWPLQAHCKQGRIHGHQLRTGGQGRKGAFSHFSTRSPLRTNRPTDRRTDKASYRVACPQLKRMITEIIRQYLFVSRLNHDDGLDVWCVLRVVKYKFGLFSVIAQNDWHLCLVKDKYTCIRSQSIVQRSDRHGVGPTSHRRQVPGKVTIRNPLQNCTCATHNTCWLFKQRHFNIGFLSNSPVNAVLWIYAQKTLRIFLKAEFDETSAKAASFILNLLREKSDGGRKIKRGRKGNNNGRQERRMAEWIEWNRMDRI